MLLMLFSGFREKALAVTNYKGVEPAMEWLLAHADDPAMDAGQTIGSSSNTEDVGLSQPQSSSSSETVPEAKSLKCEDCGKLFKNREEVEYHAAKTNHSIFSESAEEKKPLTEEEKKEQLALLEERMKQKRKEREERDKVCTVDFLIKYYIYHIIVTYPISKYTLLKILLLKDKPAVPCL